MDNLMGTMLAPLIALVAWTFVVWGWLFAVRIPAIARLKVDVQKAADDPGSQPQLPVSARRVGNNYNHLHEQPTLFYALALALEVMGQAHPINVALAWGYVASRVLHSLVQGTINIIPLRFALFVLGSLILMALTLHGAMALLHHHS